MSHFTVAVIGDNPEDQLAPFHDFECTGLNDQYVKDIDITEEAREVYDYDTSSMVVSLDGSENMSKYDDRCYRRATDEEMDKLGNNCYGFGCSNGLAYQRVYPENGADYVAVNFIPDGWEEKELPTSELKTFAEFVSDYYGNEVVPFGDEPDIDDTHQYGYVSVDCDGKVTKVIQRTNPSKKWDWYVLGGRYSDRLILKDGTTADQAVKSDIDFRAMSDEAANKKANYYDKIWKVIKDTPDLELFEDVHERLPVDEARKFYHDQPRKKALNEAAKTDGDLRWVSDLEDFQKLTRDEFIQNARDTSFSSFAVLFDGEWKERGEMGWWGCVSNEKDTDDWQEEFNKYIASIPDDTLISIYDCHI